MNCMCQAFKWEENIVIAKGVIFKDKQWLQISEFSLRTVSIIHLFDDLVTSSAEHTVAIPNYTEGMD